MHSSQYGKGLFFMYFFALLCEINIGDFFRKIVQAQKEGISTYF